MYFGSVKFFRHLILTVFFGWLGVATILAVFFGIKCHFLREEIKDGTDISDEMTVEEYISAMNKSGISSDEILRHIRTSDNEAFQKAVSDALSVQANGRPSDSEIFTDDNHYTEPAETIPPTTDEYFETTVPETDSDFDFTETVTDEPEYVETTVTEPVHTEPPATKPVQTTPVQTKPAQTEKPPQDLGSAYPELYVNKKNGSVPDPDNVFLTFDNGTSEYSYDLITILKRQGISATFFISDVSSSKTGERIEWIADTGSAFGILAGVNKNYSSADEYFSDFNSIFKEIYNKTGTKPSVCRIPDSMKVSAGVRKEILAELERRGFAVISYNISPDCGSESTWDSIYNETVDEVYINELMGTPSIIRINVSSENYNAILTIEDIIESLRKDGSRFRTLSSDSALESITE